jgi:membrane-bound serine protease (ClpP class)
MTNGWCGSIFKRCCERWEGSNALFLAWAIAILFLSAGSSLSAQTESPVQPPAHVNLIVVDTMINPATADFIRESIEQSAHDGAQALVIQLDTPGGLLTSTKDIVQDIFAAPLPVIVYVAPSGASAGSAGVFITMSGHVAAMAPGTTIGAAHPVASGGQNIEGDMREKIENFTATFSESIAQRRGRNVEWAQKAVRESVVITEAEALQKKVVDFTAVDIQDVLRKADGRKVEVGNTSVTVKTKPAQPAGGLVRVVQLEMRLKHKLLNIVADPTVAYLLMMAGLLGLYLEFSHPGIGFAGIGGGICLLLALTAFQVLPISYAGVSLLLLGIGLLVAELFLPTFGILGLGGVVAFVLGSLFLFDAPEQEIVVDRSVIATVALCAGFIMFTLTMLAARAWRQKPVSGTAGLVGAIGEVRVRIAPRGKVWVHGEYWNAESDEEIEVGEKVQVIALHGLVMKVCKAVEQ